ncbi:hypothetical protein [Phreatobacter stygius]|uniref:Uncharacterized protein n=1 Tax=Phreatobacter stygius TaxID=1940610 RepID=A0A4D7ASH5_9HYPH|nr:hypothetical protein [Phreatobacter stygius]QCI64424.1 hypothetical protein E8M01_09385 [Phreatobacter stygius]
MPGHPSMPVSPRRRAGAVLALIGAALLLAGCADWNWQATGERWVDQACRQSGNCRPFCDDAGAPGGICRGAPRMPQGR